MRSPVLRAPIELNTALANASRDTALLQKHAPTADIGRAIQAELRAVEHTIAKAKGVSTEQEIARLHRYQSNRQGSRGATPRGGPLPEAGRQPGYRFIQD